MLHGRMYWLEEGKGGMHNVGSRVGAIEMLKCNEHNL